MKTKPMIMAMLLFIMSCAVSASAANFSANMEGYYGGTLSMNGQYKVVNLNAATFDHDLDMTMTYQYNNFSVIPSVYLQGTITTTDTNSGPKESETVTCNLSVLIGGTSYSLVCYCQIIDNDIITPDSYIKINDVSYPVSEDLLDIISNLGMIID